MALAIWVFTGVQGDQTFVAERRFNRCVQPLFTAVTAGTHRGKGKYRLSTGKRNGVQRGLLGCYTSSMPHFSMMYPAKPYHLNQGFGSNPDYYLKFHDVFGNPLKGHNGNDLMGIHGQPVYAPHDGQAWYATDSHGGCGIYVRTTEPFDAGDGNGSCYFRSVLWHLCAADDPQYPIKIRTDGQGQMVKAGDLLGYADNTGAPFESTGDHIHCGLARVTQTGSVINPGNGFNGDIDPLPFFDGFYAEDAQKVFSLYGQLIVLLKKLLGSN